MSKKTYRNPNVSITIRKPDNKGRKNYSLSLVKINDQGERSQEVYKHSRVDELNAQFHGKLLTSNEVISELSKFKEKEVKKIKKKLGLTIGDEIKVNASNELLVKRYLADDYSKKKNLKEVTKKNIRNEFKAVLNMLGSSISLLTASEDEIYYQIRGCTRYSHENKRRLVCRVNALLKKAGRDFVIPKLNKKRKRKIPHITEEELTIFQIHLNLEIDKLACKIFFYTGMRTGELFGLTINDVDFEDCIIDINKQLTREFKIDKPKCNKERDIIFPEFLTKDLKEWFEISEEIRKNRRNGMSKRFLNASRKIWGKSSVRDISPHDLRRSFAIHLLSEKGFTITDVAFLLGDNESVVQDYYAGYSLTENMIVNLKKKLA